MVVTRVVCCLLQCKPPPRISPQPSPAGSPRHSVTGECPAHDILLYQHLQRLHLQQQHQQQQANTGSVRQAFSTAAGAAAVAGAAAGSASSSGGAGRRHSPPSYTPMMAHAVHDAALQLAQHRNSPPPKAQNLCMIKEDTTDSMELSEQDDDERHAVAAGVDRMDSAAVTSARRERRKSSIKPDVQISITDTHGHVTSVSSDDDDSSSSSSSSDDDDIGDDVVDDDAMSSAMDDAPPCTLSTSTSASTISSSSSSAVTSQYNPGVNTGSADLLARVNPLTLPYDVPLLPALSIYGVSALPFCHNSPDPFTVAKQPPLPVSDVASTNSYSALAATDYHRNDGHHYVNNLKRNFTTADLCLSGGGVGGGFRKESTGNPFSAYTCIERRQQNEALMNSLNTRHRRASQPASLFSMAAPQPPPPAATLPQDMNLTAPAPPPPQPQPPSVTATTTTTSHDESMSVSLRRTLSDIRRHLELLLEHKKAELAYERLNNSNSYVLQNSAICMEMQLVCNVQRAQNSLKFRKIAGDSTLYNQLCSEFISYMQTCQ